MEEACKIQAGRISGDFSLTRFGHDLRRIVPGILYLASYIAVEWGVKASGLSPVLGDFTLTTGLSVGLILIYGRWYAPIVFIATALDGLWLQAIPYSTPVTLLYCMAVSLAQVTRQ
jgi:hypothetical protein